MEICMTVAGSATQQVVDYTLAPIARQVGYLIFYEGNFKDLEDQVKELNSVKESIKNKVKEERRNGREIKDIVQNWLNRVDEITEAAKQLSDDPRRNNAGCSKWSCLHLRSRHQLSRKAKKMSTHVVEVMQEKNKFDGVGYLPPLDGVGSTSATSSEKLESRNIMKQDIVLRLKDPKISRIGIYGLGGVGKTTLVKEVAKQVKDNGLFEEVVIANISEDPDLGRIQDELADFLGLQFQERSIVGRGRRLFQRIKQERSILIVLDNVEAILDLEKLGIPLEKDHEGCKLLLTSRNQDILKKMGILDLGLNVLNPVETWSLFREMVGDALNDGSLHSIAAQVAERCAGLTVLIVTVAKALKNKKDIRSWEDALKQLQTVDKHGMTEKIYSALEFSYNHLEDGEVKSLFLLCGVLLYSNGFLPVEYLLKCVTGLGIMKNINTVSDARLRLNELLGSLQASFLLLETNTKVKMHDTITEVAVSIASRDQHVFKLGRGAEIEKWPPENLTQGCRQIFLEECHINKLPERLDCPNVEFFYLANVNHSLDIPNSFFEGKRNLKVLDLTCMHLSSLPNSFDSLTYLKTLCLDQCVLGDMTKIGALKNLQTLSLYESSIIRLPSELGQLTPLKMLDLTNSGIEIFPSNIISKLTNLEELYVGNTSIKWDLENSVVENKNATLSELRHLTKLTVLEIQIQGALVLPRDIMFENLERYKILIGDVWEWSNNYGASKMLKLKLHTSIHLEHGIKELIKGAEDLYLDEINGISNVIYHLNGEGFPLLKHLHIQNNVEIQHIIDSRERNQTDHAFFPELETLVLQNIGNLEKICDGSLTINSFAKLRSVKVKCCDQLKYLFPFLMVKALSKLVEIEVLECNSMKKIVFLDGPSPNSATIGDNIEFCSLRSLILRHLPAVDVFCTDESTSSITKRQDLLGNVFLTSFFNARVKFSNLETLKLNSINLNKIWDDDDLSIASSFHNLANLSVENCSGFKYLFTCSMIRRFLNLKQVEVNKCDMMEEIIAIGGENGATEEVQLSKLETMVINNMTSLKKVWHFQFDGLKTLEVNNCEKLENIFSSDMQRTFGSLETLKVSDCGSMEEIFQLTANEIRREKEDNVTQVTQLKKLHLHHLPKFKQIWSKDPQGIIHFCHLQDVQVEYCMKLEYLFPFSIATNLLQLEKLFMNACDGMKKIVAKKEGPMGEKAIFNFQQLHSLVILNMDELDGFYAENHILACPSLRVLRVFMCAKLELFEIRERSIQRKKSSISMQQPLFVVEEVIPTLENLNLSSKDAAMIGQEQQWRGHFRKLEDLMLYNFTDKQSATFIDSILQKAPYLANLAVQDSSLREIFEDGRLACKEGKNEINMQLKKLTLCRLQELQHICREGCQIDSMLEVLGVLYVLECASLKFLVPPSITFSHLTYLKMEKCNGLKNLIYSSTARSLVKLGTMIIKECGSLEEIVTQEVGETLDEIGFSSLKNLKLKCLPKLYSFSSSKCLFKFPLLKRVVVRECPRMKIFCAREPSAPMLGKVIKEGKDEEWCRKGDLNGTLKKICLDKVPFLEHLDLSLYPELKDSWYNPIGNKMFCNLKSLVVQKCDFLSNVLIYSNSLQALCNLEELEVRDCESLEVVFEFDSTSEAGMSQEESINLKKISLFNLPKLQHIWRQDCQEIVSSGNSLDGICQGLKVSKASDIGKKSEEIEVEIQHQQPLFSAAKVLFPNLETIIIKDMPELKTLWHRFFISNFISSLKTMEVSGCEKLENIFPSYMQRAFISLKELMVSDCNSIQMIFEFSSQMGSAEDTTSLQTLTLFRLSELKQIWSKDPEANHHFHNLKHVCVEDCENLEYLLPFSIATHAIRLEDITLKQAGRMKQIVPDKEATMDSPVEFEFNHLTSLVLWNLHELEGFFAGKHSLRCPLLRELDIYNCAKLKLFKTQDLSSQGRVSNNELIQISMQQPIFTLEEAIGEGDEGNKEPSSSIAESTQTHQWTMITGASSSEGQSKVDQIVDAGKQEIHKLPHPDADIDTKKMHEITETSLNQASQNTLGLTKVDAVIETQEMHETTKGDSVKAVQNLLDCTIVRDAEMHETIERSLVQATEIALGHTTVYGAAIGTIEMNETIQTPLVQAVENTLTPTSVQEKVLQTQEIFETFERPSIQAIQSTLSPNIIQNTVIGTQDIDETIQRPLFQTAEDTSSLISVHDTESHDSNIKTQEICETIKRPLVQAAQNVQSSTMVHDAGSNDSSIALKFQHDPGMLSTEDLPSPSTNFVIAENRETMDPSPSQAQEPMTSSKLAVDNYSSYMEMIEVTVQNMPYLEAGVKWNPQVLDWLHTKRRRVFASSSFSLFADVTCLLRTTRRGELTDDDRNYIRECCNILEVVGFDTSWLSYVYRCIEECGDGEDLKKKVEEAEGQASSLKGQASSLKAQLESINKELASVEASLVLLRDKASKLDDFIES